MQKLERSPSHSWWWDSHNSPKHSKWLQSNLQDLDEKVKEMLRLIEEDADSFAQRAEMYYQKRPELVNLVEEFYRAYRSLAERYDHLTGEIRHNIPRALQVQYGLSCDSPKSASANGSRHRYSPLRRSNHMFGNLLKKACQMEEQEQAKDSDHTGDCTQSLQGKCADDVCTENVEQNGHNDDSQHNSSDGGLSSSSSDSEVDNLTPLTKLQQEIYELKESNGVLADSHQRALELNSALQNKVKKLEESYKTKTDEVDALRSRVDALNKDLLCLRSVSKEQFSVGLVNEIPEKEPLVDILPYLEEELTDLYKENNMVAECKHEHHSIELESLQEQRLALLDGLQNQIAQLKEANRKQKLEILDRGEEKREAIRQLCFTDLYKENNMVAECKHEHHSIELESLQEQRLALLNGLQNQIAQLKEENRKQKLEILDRGEEKREAIRQLCFSMDVLKSKNQKLEVMLGLLKNKVNASNARVAYHSPSPAWKQLFSVGDWRIFRRGQAFTALAL